MEDADLGDAETTAAAEANEAVPIAIDPSLYAGQLQAKLLKLRALFAASGSVALPDDIKIHESKPIHYRERAQFAVYHKGQRMQLAVLEHSTGALSWHTLWVGGWVGGRLVGCVDVGVQSHHH